MSFEDAMKWLLSPDAEGATYAEPPRIDQPTKAGITLPVLREWQGPEVTKDDLKDLSINEIYDIYNAYFWEHIEGDSLPPGLALVTFDTAVNSGQSRALKWLQAVCGVKQDGAMGPNTMAAAKAVDQPTAINDYIGIREHFLRNDPDWVKYGKGWLNRLTALKVAAFQA